MWVVFLRFDSIMVETQITCRISLWAIFNEKKVEFYWYDSQTALTRCILMLL